MASHVAGSMQLPGDLLVVNKIIFNMANRFYLLYYLLKSRAESLICSEVLKIYNASSLGNSSLPPVLQHVPNVTNNLANQRYFTFFNFFFFSKKRLIYIFESNCN